MGHPSAEKGTTITILLALCGLNITLYLRIKYTLVMKVTNSRTATATVNQLSKKFNFTLAFLVFCGWQLHVCMYVGLPKETAVFRNRPTSI